MKLWFAPKIGGQQWHVYLVSPRSKYLRINGERKEGVCNYERCAIYVDQSLPETVQHATCFHELDHAVNYVGGVHSLLDNDAELEERINERREPIWHRLLSDLGFGFPKA